MARRRDKKKILVEKFGDEGEMAVAAYKLTPVENPEEVLRQLELESGIKSPEERGDEEIELEPPPGG